MIEVNDKVYEIADDVDFKFDNDNEKKQVIYLYRKDKVFALYGVNIYLICLCVDNKVYKIEKNLEKIFFYNFILKHIVKESQLRGQESIIKNQYTYMCNIEKEYYILNLLYKTIDKIPEEIFVKIKNNNYNDINNS